MQRPENNPDPTNTEAHHLADDLEQRALSEHIVRSLNAAAEEVQRQSLGRKGVLEVVTNQLAARGLVSAIALLDESGQYLSFAQVSGHERTLRAAQELTGLRTDQARIPLDSVPAYGRAIQRRQPTYFAADESFFAQKLPEFLKGLAKTALDLLPPLKMIVAPMIVGDRVVGLLAAYGETLSEGCCPAMAAFANHTAIAIHNAQLVDRLRESEEQYRGIFEGATDAFLLLDQGEIIVEANPATCEMYGYDLEEIIGLSLARLVHPSRHQQMSGLRQTIASQGRFRAQSIHVRKDGAAFHAEVRGTQLSQRGQLHILLAVLDTTEHEKAQQAQIRAEKLRALAQMAGGIAHEFNNILVGIRGYADLAMLKLPQDPDSAREDLEYIVSSALDAARAVRRLQHLYDRADDLSDLVPVQLDDLASQALEMTRPLWQRTRAAQGGSLMIETHLTAPPLVLGNRRELCRVLARIIANAIDAMSAGGTLTVTTGCDGNSSFITVSDTGAGVASTLQEKAFEPFYTAEKDEAIALGMTMSMNILERHGGELTADSHSGLGTTFTLRLPALSKSAPPGDKELVAE